MWISSIGSPWPFVLCRTASSREEKGAASGEEPYFSAYLNRVYPIVRKVESDARVTAVKSWDEIIREHDEQKHEEARREPASRS